MSKALLLLQANPWLVWVAMIDELASKLHASLRALLSELGLESLLESTIDTSADSLNNNPPTTPTPMRTPHSFNPKDPQTVGLAVKEFIYDSKRFTNAVRSMCTRGVGVFHF